MPIQQQIRPAAAGMSGGAPPPGSIAVVFGASGDLSRRKLLPAVYHLARHRLLPDSFGVIGFALERWDDERFRDEMRQAVAAEPSFDAEAWRWLARRMRYVAPAGGGDYGDLRRRLDDLRGELGTPDRAFFYLAVPPSAFEPIVGGLDRAGLSRSGEGGWRRIVVEKPFGEDAESAERLEVTIGAVFDEDAIYRIDHFLGKETVQNLVVVRFANPELEPVWNRRYVDHVQITAAEEIGIGGRGRFYDRIGVVRDVLQNHLLQLLCLVAMEPPVAFDAKSLRDETAKVLEATSVEPGDGGLVLGQYGPGSDAGGPVAGYREEANVPRTSTTPTFVAAKLAVDNWRWAGVPFYLRAGKRMPRKLTEIAIQFKPTPHAMFPRPGGRAVPSSLLAFRLQPEEGILQTFAAKRPGPDLEICEVTSHFLYAEAFGIAAPPPAYAWLLLDVLRGDQTLFARRDWIARAWDVVRPVLAAESGVPPDAFPNYASGSWGPQAAEALVARDGRSWRDL